MSRYVAWIAFALALPALWFVVHFAQLTHDPVTIALASGAGIFGAAFLLSWTSEVAQLDIPQALALAFLALVAVLPEYAVDALLDGETAMVGEQGGVITRVPLRASWEETRPVPQDMVALVRDLA